MKRWLRAPFLHFLLLGGVLFAAEKWLLPPPVEPLAVDEALVEQLRADWQRETGRAPSAAQLQASLTRQLDDERLLREALRLQLDARDAVARSRLIANLRFALDSKADDATLLEQARHLNLAARDLVVRRRLIQVMEHRLLEQQAPPEAELRAYIQARPERYAQPAKYSFEQRYFSKDAHRDAAAVAQAALAQPENSGESFLLGAKFELLSETEIRTRFGSLFAQAVAQALPNTWSGPVASPYGAHLIRVTGIRPAQSADYTEIRAQAAYAWLAENQPQQLQAALAPLRARYPAELTPAVQAMGLRV